MTSVCLSALTVFPNLAKAQVGVSPLIIQSEARRGQAQGMITIKNTGNTRKRVRLYAQPFTYSRDAGFQILKSSPNDLTPYLQFSPRELTIPPNTRRRVRLYTRMPPNLPDRELRAVVFNETLKQTKDGDGNNVALKTRIGVTVFVANGDIASELKIDKAGFNRKKEQIQLLVSNKGNETVRPKIRWKLSHGKTTIHADETRKNFVIAQSDRNILLNFPAKKQLAPGIYQLSGNLEWKEDEDVRKLPFNVNVTIPTSDAVK
ncbi:P pilus assembly protein, chaperone PapD [Mastigocoleus testarum BC008]|uniref:P pilus assembly protein, chaperone PapD n=1 Tax=Mastigocoleus testarum BC008 TaxID=371196 RepID=A0A0V7ZGS7_9CYAN|nr:P pilus assembly protein, chaperone PapD [Mastigocoleus testarum BC008]KST63803.1 P pilus assembly protein, chaperone PapD [Mastigocoleus testarum BC008]